MKERERRVGEKKIGGGKEDQNKAYASLRT